MCVQATRRCLTLVLALYAGQVGAASLRQVQRLLAAEQGDSPCSDSPAVSRDACLGKNDGKCMWLELDTKNLCLPCAEGDVELPCAVEGSIFPSGRVRSCSMACSHHEIISKVSLCTDVSGDISKSDCEAKGTSGGTKCMWTAYKTAAGIDRRMCGPCNVDGVGEVPAYVAGGAGPEPGSQVTASSSQCDLVVDGYGFPCDPVNGIPAVTPCRPTAPPTLAGGLPVPVPLDTLGLSVPRDEVAPDYVAVPVERPYSKREYIRAATAAARVAGWPVGSALPPTASVTVFAPPPYQGPTLPPEIKSEYSYAMPPGLRGIQTVYPIPGAAGPQVGGSQAGAEFDDPCAFSAIQAAAEEDATSGRAGGRRFLALGRARSGNLRAAPAGC